jgi:hypothetical protein
MPRKRILTEKEISEKAKRLIYLINFSRASRAELCAGTNIKPDTLYRWMTGKLQGIGHSGAASLLPKLRAIGIICSEDWLLFGEGPPPYRSLSVLSPVLSAEPEKLEHADEENTQHHLQEQNQNQNAIGQDIHQDLKKEIEFFQEHHSNAIGLILKDEAMAPVFRAGDYVAGVRTQNFAGLFGEFCLVQRESTGELLACRLERGEENDAFTLLCLNPSPQRPIVLLNQKILTAAKIIWRRLP